MSADPVAWLEHDLDAETAGQDAASIRERLAALEATLTAANAVDPVTHWDAAADPADARCQRCRQPVDEVTEGPDRYDPARTILTAHPCGHHDGYTRSSML